MRERLRPAALDSVRGELLIDAIATQENITVSDDELHERVAEMARARGVPVARLRAELDRDGELEDVRYQLRRDRALDMLIERATVTEVEPSEEDDTGEAGEQAAALDQGDEAGAQSAQAETGGEGEESSSESENP